MIWHSTREAAKKLGIDHSTLAKYLADGKLSLPETFTVGKRIVHMWTDAEIEHVRKLLPKIANGRKTRYQKLREKQKPEPGAPQPQHAKSARAGGPRAVPHKPRKPKKKQ
jgi:predicted DNA-binding transcriptional regulator AlpA